MLVDYIVTLDPSRKSESPIAPLISFAIEPATKGSARQLRGVVDGSSSVTAASCDPLHKPASTPADSTLMCNAGALFAIDDDATTRWTLAAPSDTDVVSFLLQLSVTDLAPGSALTLFDGTSETDPILTYVFPDGSSTQALTTPFKSTGRYMLVVYRGADFAHSGAFRFAATFTSQRSESSTGTVSADSDGGSGSGRSAMRGTIAGVVIGGLFVTVLAAVAVVARRGRRHRAFAPLPAGTTIVPTPVNVSLPHQANAKRHEAGPLLLSPSARYASMDVYVPPTTAVRVQSYSVNRPLAYPVPPPSPYKL